MGNKSGWDGLKERADIAGTVAVETGHRTEEEVFK
jgi:hypothetical protein